jgi:hypothetical protein
MGYKEKKDKATCYKDTLLKHDTKKRVVEEKIYSHVLKIKLKGREIIQRVNITISSPFHTHAHLDQIV